MRSSSSESNLLLLGLVDRPTADLDVIALNEKEHYRRLHGIPVPLARAVAEAADALGIASGWLNDGPAPLTGLGLPPGWQERAEVRRYGALEVSWRARVAFARVLGGPDCGAAHGLAAGSIRPNAVADGGQQRSVRVAGGEVKSQLNGTSWLVPQVVDGESTYRRGSVPGRTGRWPSIYAAYLGTSDGPSVPHLALLRVGLAEPTGSPQPLVRSYRTVSPLPVPRWGHRRSAFCCAFLRVTPTGR